MTLDMNTNNVYYLDMTGITDATTITLVNENNLPTEEILTDWGDGTQNSELTHTYSTAGEYVVVSNLQNAKASGNLKDYITKMVVYYASTPANMCFNYSKITEVTLTNNWAEKTIEKYGQKVSITQMFHNCPLLEFPNLEPIKQFKPTYCVGMFFNCQKFTSIDLTGWDFSNCTGMELMFGGCSNLTEIRGIEDWDVSKCTTMAGMFIGCKALTSLDVSGWNFEKCTAINQFIRDTTNLVDFNMSGVAFGATGVNFQNFAYQSGVQNVNMSNITTAGKVSFESPFYGCSKLKTIDFSNSHFKPSNMQNMFRGCSSLQTLDLSMFNTSECTSLNDTFNGCGISVVNLANWNTSKVTTFGGMFSNCSNLTHADLSSFTAENCTGCANMFLNCKNLKTVDLSSFKPLASKKVNSEGMFATCPSLEKIDLSNFDTESMSKFNNLLNWGSPNITLGLLYASASTINDVISTWGTVKNGIVYYYDADPTQLTPVKGVTFKKYQTPTTIQLPPHIQLHSLPDGTRDEVDIKTGILTRNVGFITLDRDEINWFGGAVIGCGFRMWKTSETSGRHYQHWVEEYGLDSTGIEKSGCLSKDLTFVKDGNSFETRTTPALWARYELGVPKMGMFIPNVTTFAEAKTYLDEHPFEIMYPLPTPTTEQLILNYNNSCDYGRILPTGMCDKYDVVNSMYTQTMTSILLDGANTWDAMEEFENTVKFTATGTTVGVENLNMLGAGGLYCDNDLFPNINDDSDVEHCRVDEEGNKFYIYVNKERLMSPDLIGWQIWLQANPFNLIYELAEHLTYVQQYEELDATQARWEGMDCMRDGAIKYHANNSDNITMYPTLEYVAPSINNFEVTMLEPNTDYTIYAKGINDNDTINLGGNDINFNNGTVYTSGDNQWLRIDNNDSFYNMVITKGDTTGEHVPYFEGMASVKMPVLTTTGRNIFNEDLFLTYKNIGYKKTSNGYTTTTVYFNSTYYPLQLKPNTTYYFDKTADSQGNTIISIKIGKTEYITGNSGGFDNISYGLKTFTTDDTGLIRIRGGASGNGNIGQAHIEHMWIHEGEKAIPYEPHKSNILTVNESIELRGIGNIKDKLNCLTGEITQYIKDGLLDGTETWTGVFNSTTSVFFTTSFNIVVGSELIYDTLPDGVIEFTNDNGTLKVITTSEFASIAVSVFIDKLKENPIPFMYCSNDVVVKTVDLKCVNQAGEVIDNLCVFDDGTIHLSSDTGLLPTTHYSVPSTNTFNLASMKTGTRYTLKYPSASGSITIGDITYKISSDSMLFTTPLKINGDTSAIIFSDANPENVVLLEGAYNKREVPFFTGVKSVKNPNITIIDQLSTESTTYNCETEIELRGLPNGIADKLDIIKGKLTTNVGIRPYQEGDENLPNVWTDGYETVYALSSPIVTNVEIGTPYVTTNSLIGLSSNYLIPQLNYRASSSNNFPLDLLQPNQTYTLYADTLVSGSYTLGGTKTGVYSQPHTITLEDMTDNLLTFNGDLGLSNVMLVKGNSLKTTLPPYFLGIRSVTDGHLLVEGMAGEINELTFDEGIVLRDCSGVKDTIDLITCTLTKRTGEITLTGAEGWYRADSESTTDYNVFKLTLGGLKEALVMCDTLQSVFDTKMMDCIHAHANELCIVIANATIGGNTVNALKSWLNQHPTTVVYQLRTPIEVQLKNTWTILPPTSYNNQTEISSTVSANSLKPMISVTIATTTLEEIVSNLEAQNAQLEEENIATMLALTSIYETMVAPSVATTEPQMATYGLRRSIEPVGMSVSPIGMVYARLVSKGFKSIDEVPYNLQTEVIYALRGME